MIKDGIESLGVDRRGPILSFLEFIRSVPAFGQIRFIVLYGSVALRTDDPGSDIDIAISCELEDLESERLRMYILGRVPDIFDVHIFEHLPLYIRKDVLGGMALYVRDEDEIYNAADRTIREYDFFRPHLLDYIGERVL
ncbi:MAG: nucleotidyltransferase domain-containing protein [Methanomicrobiales archaeon HGW-Methanomicrobiales-4]|nr:MAG: nucleotidyltransferase domain-containing protein [Methanomicrobiales archaeon HGW-Methanomicrobiales-4]